MIHLLAVFWKILIRRFYIINAGFFLLSFILMFGIIHPPEIILVHASLIHGIINSNIFTWLILLLWLMYHLKCTLFCTRIIGNEDSYVVYNLQSVSSLKQLLLLFICHCCLYFPVLLYSGFVVYMENEEGFKLYSLGIIFFQCLMCAAAVRCYYNQINFTWKEQRNHRKSLPALNLLHAKAGLAGYLLYYTFSSRKVVYLVLKSTGIFLLHIMLAMSNKDFIMRDFVLVFMIVILMHSLLIYFYVDFIERKMSFIRNMPIPRFSKLLGFTITYLLILLPELLFMMFNAHGLLAFSAIITFYAIGNAELLLFTSVLYLKSIKMKPYLQRVFGIYLVFSILMLSGNYIAILVILAAVAVLVFYSNYYNYEAEI